MRSLFGSVVLFVSAFVAAGQNTSAPPPGGAAAPPDADELPPLHTAAESEEPSAPEKIKALLDGGANPNELDAEGRTALMIAAVRNPQRQTAALLISAGAKVDIADKKGNTALHYAMGFFGSFGQPRNLGFIGELLAADADQKARNQAGWTPLMAGALAAGCDHLLAFSDPPNVVPEELEARTPEGWTPLMLAVASIKPEIWKQWLAQMPGVHPAMLQDAQGLQMFTGMSAEYARHGYVGRVWVLLRNGADPNAKANDGTTVDSILAGIDEPDAAAVRALLKVAQEHQKSLKAGDVRSRDR
jgi:ankyrin repeat protein